MIYDEHYKINQEKNTIFCQSSSDSSSSPTQSTTFVKYVYMVAGGWHGLDQMCIYKALIKVVN